MRPTTKDVDAAPPALTVAKSPKECARPDVESPKSKKEAESKKEEEMDVFRKSTASAARAARDGEGSAILETAQRGRNSTCCTFHPTSPSLDTGSARPTSAHVF
jgi:hypothetical protein